MYGFFFWSCLIFLFQVIQVFGRALERSLLLIFGKSAQFHAATCSQM